MGKIAVETESVNAATGEAVPIHLVIENLPAVENPDRNQPSSGSRQHEEKRTRVSEPVSIDDPIGFSSAAVMVPMPPVPVAMPMMVPVVMPVPTHLGGRWLRIFSHRCRSTRIDQRHRLRAADRSRHD
jgi:hypothetical protein